jgi:putative N6-adenine-specific DNA methylase
MWIFIDFMCGSGTILIEASMAALNIPAGFYRAHFGFFSWLNFDNKMWQGIVDEARILSDININLYGYDISPRYLGMAKVNVEEAGLQDFITLKKKDMLLTSPLRTPAFIISNPPYGERLEVDDINAFYKQIGDTLKNNYPQCTAFIISSDFDALKNLDCTLRDGLPFIMVSLSVSFLSMIFIREKNSKIRGFFCNFASLFN